MKCLYCETEDLLESSAACPSCGFELTELEQVMGVPPILRPEVNDLAGVLTRKQRAVSDEKLISLGLQFPQCRFAVVLVESTGTVSLPMYAFWLFNKGGLAAPMEKQGDCRLVMLVLDVQSCAALCMLGYGLEPFISTTRLQQITDVCQQAMKQGDHDEAVRASLWEIEQLLAQTAKDIPLIYGLSLTGQEEQEDEQESYAY